jgi:hypothetical protein
MLELIQLLRTLNKTYTPLIEEDNRKIIRKYLTELYEQNFGKLDEKNIENLYKTLKN